MQCRKGNTGLGKYLVFMRKGKTLSIYRHNSKTWAGYLKSKVMRKYGRYYELGSDFSFCFYPFVIRVIHLKEDQIAAVNK